MPYSWDHRDHRVLSSLGDPAHACPGIAAPSDPSDAIHAIHAIRACPECGLPVRVSAAVAAIAPETLARESWHRAVRRALWIAVTALAAAIGLALAQELERRAGAFGGPALGTPGAVLRLAIDGAFLAAAILIVRGRAMPCSALPFLFLLSSLTMIGATVALAATGVRGAILPMNATLPRLEQAGHALASILLVLILFRFAWWLRSPLAAGAAGLAGAALLPLAIVGALRLLALVWWPDAGVDTPVKGFLRWIDLLRMSEPSLVAIARHAWEVPAVVAIAVILQAQRGSRRPTWAERLAAHADRHERSQPF
jgi:hypothetical protein